MDCLATGVPTRVMTALRPSPARRFWLERFIATEGCIHRRSNGDEIVTFFRYTDTPRLQQALVGLPLVDGPMHAAKFLASYLLLRGRDLLASRNRQAGPQNF